MVCTTYCIVMVIVSVYTSYILHCKVAGSNLIVRLLVATLHVGMTGKQDGGYTRLT